MPKSAAAESVSRAPAADCKRPAPSQETARRAAISAGARGADGRGWALPPRQRHRGQWGRLLYLHGWPTAGSESAQGRWPSGNRLKSAAIVIGNGKLVGGGAGSNIAISRGDRQADNEADNENAFSRRSGVAGVGGNKPTRCGGQASQAGVVGAFCTNPMLLMALT